MVGSHWRIIPPLKAPGAVQMALDRWLFEELLEGRHPPTLRFYTWSPAAISLGYHQRRFPDEWRSLHYQKQPIDLVRRPSGGRAVLHQGDLTYAVVAAGLPGSRMDAYQQICEFLMRGWRSLGYALHYGTAGRSYRHTPNCFGIATGADLVLADGTKLIGSAQLRQGDVVLQHGSMRLTPDPALFQVVFGQAATLPAIALPLPVVIETLTHAAVSWFGARFGASFEVRSLSKEEWDRIQVMVHSRL